MNEARTALLSPARQRAAAMLGASWPVVVDKIGAFGGDSIHCSPSSVHGLGLFATRDLGEGELVALHPVDRILKVTPGAGVAGALADEADEAYFGPREPSMSAEEYARRQEAYRQVYSHVNPARPDVFYIDANPQKADVAGWLGHRINDGAQLVPGCGEDELIEYYIESGAKRNVCSVALCVPLLGFVTTTSVAAGDELLATYGHQYWARSNVYQPGERADELTKISTNTAREADLWQLSADKRYSQQFALLDKLITPTSLALLEKD